LHRPLLRWFTRHGRDLPWRRSRDPYHVWVSEIMLQQTQVERVRGFFTRFIGRFPDVAALATADEQEVLRHWEGLGYYRRARQLHAAARVVVDMHGGRLPAAPEALRSLPGIGRYTANAIASIAHDVPAPIIEANSRRVIARLVAHDEPLGGTAGDGPLWEIATTLLPRRDAGRFNQALMDLGAMICTPTRPRCDACPLTAACAAHRTSRVAEIPVRATRPRVRLLRETALVLRRGGRVLMERRGAGEWWEGLWDFPRVEAGRRRPGDRRLGTLTYTVTTHRVTCGVVERQADPAVRGTAEQRWVAPATLSTLPLAAPARRIAALIARAT
jgi:A/G-specific adenine glycosylase